MLANLLKKLLPLLLTLLLLLAKLQPLLTLLPAPLLTLLPLLKLHLLHLLPINSGQALKTGLRAGFFSSAKRMKSAIYAVSRWGAGLWGADAFDVHWTMNCANDCLKLDPAPDATVPEPGTLALLLGLLGRVGLARRRRG